MPDFGFTDQNLQVSDFSIDTATARITTRFPKRAPCSQEQSKMKQAAQSGNIAIFASIFEDGVIDPNAVLDNDGWTALHYAAIAGQLEIFKLWASKGADLMPKVKSLDEFHGRTPLHYAAEAGQLEIVKFLTFIVADKNPQDDNGFTPLHIAAKNGQLAIVKLLANYLSNKNPQTGERWHKMTPLHSAAFGGHPRVFEFLLQFNKENTNPALSDGRTCLHLAAEGGHVNIIKYYQQNSKYENINLGQLSNNAYSGRTPLHYAVQSGHLDVVKYMTQFLVDKNPEDSNGMTTLHLAAGYGDLEIVKHLAGLVPNVNIKTKLNKTPLDYAKENEHYDVVEYLQDLYQ